MNLSFTFTNCFYSKFYYGRPAASANGAVDKDKGCSLADRMMFGSVGGETMLVSDPVSTPSTGWMTSSWCMPSATLERRASITHYAETCSATIYAYGTKLSPSVWMASALQPSAYPLQMVVKSRSGWCIATEVSTPDVP